MKMPKPENYESRNYAGKVELRQGEDGSAKLVGLAAIFDTLSENLGGFREQIAPGAFDDADMSDVRGLFNHDSNFVLGRTLAKTLSLRVTRKGLEYTIDLPDTQTIRDLVVGPIERGDVDQSSFGFIVAPGGATFDENEDGVLIRTIQKFARIFDVSAVTFPAYADTTVGTRGLEEFQQTITEAEAEIAGAAVKREHFLRSTTLPGL